MNSLKFKNLWLERGAFAQEVKFMKTIFRLGLIKIRSNGGNGFFGNLKVQKEHISMYER